MSYSLRPHWLQHSRLPCPSPSAKVCSNSCPLSQWCYLTISSPAAPFSSHPQSFPDQGVFQWVSSLHQVAKMLELQLQHQSFQWIFSKQGNTYTRLVLGIHRKGRSPQPPSRILKLLEGLTEFSHIHSADSLNNTLNMASLKWILLWGRMVGRMYFPKTRAGRGKCQKTLTVGSSHVYQ